VRHALQRLQTLHVRKSSARMPHNVIQHTVCAVHTMQSVGSACASRTRRGAAGTATAADTVWRRTTHLPIIRARPELNSALKRIKNTSAASIYSAVVIFRRNPADFGSCFKRTGSLLKPENTCCKPRGQTGHLRRKRASAKLGSLAKALEHNAMLPDDDFFHLQRTRRRCRRPRITLRGRASAV